MAIWRSTRRSGIFSTNMGFKHYLIGKTIVQFIRTIIKTWCFVLNLNYKFCKTEYKKCSIGNLKERENIGPFSIHPPHSVWNHESLSSCKGSLGLPLLHSLSSVHNPIILQIHDTATNPPQEEVPDCKKTDC